MLIRGRLPEAESKRIGQTSGLKIGRGRLRNLSSGRLPGRSWKTEKQDGYILSGRLREVVAYEKWSP